ncbi:MAG: hypothetical protein L0H59_19085, partial [Tomitella sp.]|nr:hypothetical protein [Tomitella sp.]
MATRQTLRLLAQLHSQIAGITDAQARDLVTAYATSWDEIAAELEGALNELTAQAVDGRVSQNKARKSKRLRASLALIAERLRELAADAEVRIVGDLDAAVRMAGEAEVGLIRSQLPAGTAELVAGFDRIDNAVIHAIIERTTEQIHSRTIPLSRDAIAA